MLFAKPPVSEFRERARKRESAGNHGDVDRCVITVLMAVR